MSARTVNRPRHMRASLSDGRSPNGVWNGSALSSLVPPSLGRDNEIELWPRWASSVGHAAEHSLTRCSCENGFGMASRRRREPGRARLISTGLVHFPAVPVALSPRAALPKSNVEKTGGNSLGKYPRARESFISNSSIPISDGTPRSTGRRHLRVLYPNQPPCWPSLARHCCNLSGELRISTRRTLLTSRIHISAIYPSLSELHGGVIPPRREV